MFDSAMEVFLASFRRETVSNVLVLQAAVLLAKFPRPSERQPPLADYEPVHEDDAEFFSIPLGEKAEFRLDASVRAVTQQVPFSDDGSDSAWSNSSSPPASKLWAQKRVRVPTT